MKDLLKPVYRTRNGVLYQGSSEDILKSRWFKPLVGNTNLIFTSPPFPLNRRKAYGNFKGDKYTEWLAGFAKTFNELLSEDGSLVIELGNAWEPDLPVMSVLSLEALLKLKEEGEFHLCQEFIWYNNARLPSPAQWVNVERIRVKDSFTRLWWLSKTTHPKADNRAVLQKYSDSMLNLLRKKKYNTGKRPSEHSIGKTSFLKNNNGSIPSNVLTIANTAANDPYLHYCKTHRIKQHPARMPPKLAEFFIRFLTDEKDIVIDPFAGSNITGYVSEQLNRRWRSIEKDKSYAKASKSRFNNAWVMRRKP